MLSVRYYVVMSFLFTLSEWSCTVVHLWCATSWINSNNYFGVVSTVNSFILPEQKTKQSCVVSPTHSHVSLKAKKQRETTCCYWNSYSMPTVSQYLRRCTVPCPRATGWPRCVAGRTLWCPARTCFTGSWRSLESAASCNRAGTSGNLAY